METHIAEPPARPRLVMFVDEMPMTPIGKLARFKLRQRAAVKAARDALMDLPILSIECDDPAAKAMSLAWRDGSKDPDRTRAKAALERLGLRMA